MPTLKITWNDEAMPISREIVDRIISAVNACPGASVEMGGVVNLRPGKTWGDPSHLVTTNKVEFTARCDADLEKLQATISLPPGVALIASR